MRKQISYITSGLLFLFLLMGRAEASFEQENERGQTIGQEMDCVSKQLSTDQNITWKDVCYTSDRSLRKGDPRRRDLISRTMDAMERKISDEGMQPIASVAVDPYSATNADVQPFSETLVPERYIAPGEVRSARRNTIDQEESIYQGPVEGEIADDFEEGNDTYEFKLFERDISAKMWDTNVKVTSGVRRDDIFWNIAGTIQGTSPNIISELTWDDLVSIQTKLEVETTFAGHFFVRAMAAQSQIVDGDNQDSDFAGDNRTLEFSRSNNSSDDGELSDYSAALGVRMKLTKHPKILQLDDLWFSALGGYSYHEQNLVIQDGFQTIPAAGAFPGLDSRYDTIWNGPFVGFEFDGKVGKLSGAFRYEYHWADYEGAGNWNLRTDFEHPTSFENITEGSGHVLGFSTDYRVTNNFSFNFDFDLQDWSTDAGVVTFNLAGGGRPKQRFNEANWDSYAVMLGGTYHFN